MNLNDISENRGRVEKILELANAHVMISFKIRPNSVGWRTFNEIWKK